MIYLGADHRGYALKEQIKQWLTTWGKEFKDMGSLELIPTDDYPDITRAVTGAMHEGDKGILLCASGIGVAITANRVKGIRCGVGITPAQVRATRTDDDINVLALASDFTSEQNAQEMIKAFLETAFSGQERHLRRIKKIDNE